jgi:hypothetical protein
MSGAIIFTHHMSSALRASSRIYEKVKVSRYRSAQALRDPVG